VQDRKKQDSILKKPGKFVPQEIEIAPLDDLTAEIENLVSMSESERMYAQMYRPVPFDTPKCDIDCQCYPCRRADCRNCTGVIKRWEVPRNDYRPY
jgi:hypothetical protein